MWHCSSSDPWSHSISLDRSFPRPSPGCFLLFLWALAQMRCLSRKGSAQLNLTSCSLVTLHFVAPCVWFSSYHRPWPEIIRITYLFFIFGGCFRLHVYCLSPPVNHYSLVSVYFSQNMNGFPIWMNIPNILNRWTKVTAIFFSSVCSLRDAFLSKSVDLSWPSVTMMVLPEWELLIPHWHPNGRITSLELLGEWKSIL